MPESSAALQTSQRDIRNEYRRRRAALSDEQRSVASSRIADAVVRTPYFLRSICIACYLSLADEVDTWAIIERAWRRKKKIFAPVTGPDRLLTFRQVTPNTGLIVNEFGILEPEPGTEISARQLDLVLTPLVAYDDDRRRIGMGGGYYDRTFAFLRNRRLLLKPKLVGLAFNCQRIEKIAENPWDIPLYRVVTEGRV
ncbi:MAG: 5-formyltetrahydrofolate cyclo-ligase [Woeseia sp.]